MADRFTHSGQCHCGAITVTLTLTKAAHEIEVRACQCGFCTRHGAATISDPGGSATITLTGGDRPLIYRFALRSAEPLLCARCGVYVGTVLRDGERGWSVANVRALGLREFDPARATPVSYEGETIEARIARRQAKWTPTVLRIDDAAALAIG